jgi:phage host-nuclease inhibitor protein Gam
LTDINTSVAGLLTTYYNAFVTYQGQVKTYFDAWINLVAGNDEIAIITNQISFQAQRGLALAGNVAFYVANYEQKTRQSWVDVADATVAYLTAVNTNAADVATKRTDLQTAIETSVQIQIDWRRAQALEDVVKAEIDRIKTDLAAQKEALKTAVDRAWADIRADIIAAFQDTAAQIETYRRRLTDYFLALQCDLTSATLTLTGDVNNADASLTIQLRSVDCFNTAGLTTDDLHAQFCASLTAYFVNEQAVATVNAYSCVAVAKKRGLLQGSAMSADMTTQNPNPNGPTSAPTSDSTSFVACIVLLLVAFLFHF